MRTKKPILLCMVFAAALLSVPLSLGSGQGLAPQADLGDAPDSTNTEDLDMEAYPGVTANFPTVFAGPNPTGPIHQNENLMFYLGSRISGEEEADSGEDTDADGANNILPATNQADKDGADDGLNLPNMLPHCQNLVLDYTVTVTDTATTGMTGYLNVWLDWDRDGSWGGESPASCPGWTTGAPEWAVQNQPVSLPGPGTYTLQTPGFPVWNPNSAESLWLRVTLSDAPAPADNGAGPAAGYGLGETEDYLLPGQGIGLFLPVVIGGVGEPPPPPTGVHIDEEEDPEVIASWPQIPAGSDVALVGLNDLTLRVDNNSGGPRTLDIRLTFITDGHEYPLSVDPLPTIQAGTYMTDVIIYPGPSVPVNSPGVIVGEVHNLLPGTSEIVSVSPIEAISFHWDESTADQLVVYREAGLEQQVSNMDFVRAPDLSGRLAALIPTGESTADLSQFVFYTSSDPVLAEEAVDPDPMEFDDIPPPPPDFQPGSHNVYLLCPEWYTAPIDNAFGEDYGLNDDGWRARGARIRVWQSGVKLYDGWLNAAGCTAVYSYSTAGLYIHFTGESRLASGGGYINLLYIKNNSTSLKATSAWIGNPVNFGVYRPEVHYRDSVGILSYAAQERFNGGVSGKWFYLRKAGCGNDPDKGSCSSGLNGDHIIYMSPGQWRRKFVAAHEYGHKILSFAAGYTNDCTFNGDTHSMTGVEYGSCAAMEGWANFVSADVWNEGHTGENPGGKLVYWNSSSTVYDVEAVGSKCYDFFYSDWLCDAYGTEIDWMRHWWDFHTNNLPNEPGSGPTHAALFDLVDAVSWDTGAWEASDAFEDELGGSMDNRWRLFACWNKIAYDVCQ